MYVSAFIHSHVDVIQFSVQHWIVVFLASNGSLQVSEWPLAFSYCPGVLLEYIQMIILMLYGQLLFTECFCKVPINEEHFQEVFSHAVPYIW